MLTEILIVTEGATEREVGKVLYERGLLDNSARPRPPDWRSLFGGSREGYHQVVEALARDNTVLQSDNRILLVFDQENLPTASDRANQLIQDLQARNSLWNGLSWSQLSAHTNVFTAQHNGARLALHVSNAADPGIANRDFDGYILDLLRSGARTTIVSHLIPSTQNPNRLLQKAEIEFTNLMRANGYPWDRNKSWLYAYITAFQFRQSHVWFAAEVIRHAPDDELRRVFRALIDAWDWLIG